MKYLFLLFVAFSLGADAKPCASVPVSGPIAERYRVLGASDGPLGCPVGSETAADRGGAAQMFETGMIITSPSLGASATLAAYQVGAEIVVEWGPVEGVAYTLFHVHWDLNGQGARQLDVGNPTRTGWQVGISATVPGQYRVAVQGCFEARPPAPLRCQGWTSDAVVEVRAGATPPQTDPRFARPGMPNRPAEPFSQPPAAQPAPQPDSRYAPPPNPAGAPPGPNGPSIPRPSYSEPGAAPGAAPNTNNPAQGYLGPRNSSAQNTPSAQTTPSGAAARDAFARSSADKSEKPAGSAPPQGSTPPPQTYAQIQFIVGTGGDDLRGDSSATATLQSPNGNTLQVVTLKGQNQSGWDKNTSHTVTLQLTPPQPTCMIGQIQITLTSHNGFGETNDNWDLKGITVVLTNGAGGVIVATGTGNPFARLTGDLPSVVLDGPNCIANVLGPQPSGPLRGFVDLHTHPLANLGFGGKLFYGGPDIGSLLPADPDCNRDVRAASMQQALGHDGSTHGSFGVGGPFSSGGFGVQNSCGDALREQVIHGVQTGTKGAADESPDAHGAPDFREWPVWSDITHQKMWVDWIQRAYAGGLRVLVALAVNNKTLGDMTAGPGDFPTDDKASADLQIGEIKAFVSRHPDFMEMAYSPADLERIVRANRLAVLAGIEVDNIGNLQTVHPLTSQAIVAEIQRLYNEGVRYIFPVHVIDNSFGGTAAYEDLFNYSNYREAGHWWNLECLYPSVNYTFQAQGFDLFIMSGEAAKLGIDFSLRHPPAYPSCGQSNALGLTAEGTIALQEMMRLGMLIDIDHMSEKAQLSAIALAKTVSNVNSGYPLNSGHSGLRGYFPSGVTRKLSDATERSMDASLYAAIAGLHGMAGVGSANLTSSQWLEMYGQVVRAMGGAVAGFGTDTDGLAMGMPLRQGSAVSYDDNFPYSRAGTRQFNYNTDGVAHYGMMNDFVRDARTLPRGVELIDNNLMSGAEYFLETWKRCEALREFVDQKVTDRFKEKPLPGKAPSKLEKLGPH